MRELALSSEPAGIKENLSIFTARQNLRKDSVMTWMRQSGLNSVPEFPRDMREWFAL
jgi:hypothetical protein